MKPGDLVRLYESGGTDVMDYTVGNFSGPGWDVPGGTIALVIKVVSDKDDGTTCHILVDGKMGWAYEEDCRSVDET